MRFVLSGLAFAVIGIWIGVVISLLRKSKKKIDNLLILPKFVLILGTVIGVGFLIPTAIILLTDAFWGYALVCFLISLIFGVPFAAAYVNCRITYDETAFEVRNFFGIKRRYTYDSVTGITGGTKDVILYMGKRSVNLYEMYAGRDKFLSYVKIQYRRNNGKGLPMVKDRFDIFNGNVENPRQILFAFVLRGITFAICLGVIIYGTCAISIRETVVSFSDYKIVYGDLQLYTENNTSYFKISSYKEHINNPDEFLSSCEKGEKFKVEYEKYKSHYSVESIVGENGDIYLLKDDTHKYDSLKNLMLILLCSVICVICVVLTALTIYVGRHPEKFSKRVVHMFIREGYIHYN